LRALFNFVIDTFEMNIKNPCCVPQLFKSFKNIQQRPRKILDKETVDEIIFNYKNTRDRLILELQARCGLRVGEVLNLKVSDVSQRKLMLQEPKSGREVEVAFMPEHIAIRLADFIASRNLSQHDRVFGICYTTTRNLVTKLGQKLNVHISPHNLRRHLLRKETNACLQLPAIYFDLKDSLCGESIIIQYEMKPSEVCIFDWCFLAGVMLTRSEAIVVQI
jgi:integrase